MLGDGLGDLVVALPMDHRGHIDLVVVLVEPHRGSEQLHFNAESVHLGQSLRERLGKASLAQFSGRGVEAVPVALRPDGVLETLRRQVGVHVDDGHGRPLCRIDLGNSPHCRGAFLPTPDHPDRCG